MAFLLEFFDEYPFLFFVLAACFTIMIGFFIVGVSVACSEDCMHYFQTGAFCKNCGDMLQSFCPECGAALK